ncbi:MAG: hypothetical protein KDB79_08160, partial [Acidobacteria bacterium]|nr:hypothetical protein [Acidobacteriota bacterium]
MVKSKDLNRSPFLLPAAQYYIISAGLVLVSFIFLSWVFMEPKGGIPWVSAGLLACLLFVAAVILREVVLKNERNKYVAATRRLDRNIRSVKPAAKISPKKFSFDDNVKILKDIEEKSKAAQTLSKLPDAHLEVFELCENYLNFAQK